MCASTSAAAAVLALRCAGSRAHTTDCTQRKASGDYSPSRTRAAGSPRSTTIWRFGVNASDVCFLLAPRFEGNPAAHCADTGFFPLFFLLLSTKWQPCCRQPGSPAAVCARRDGQPAVPPHSRSQCGCCGSRSCLVLLARS